MVRRTARQSWHGFVSGQRVRMLIETQGATADDDEIAHPSGTLATIAGLANFGDFQGDGVDLVIGDGIAQFAILSTIKISKRWAASRSHSSNMTKAVFTSKVEPSYDDLPEQRYHFPRVYLGQVEATAGDWIIYYEPRRSSSDHGHSRLSTSVALNRCAVGD